MAPPSEPPLLRVAVTAAPGDEAEEALRARVAELFPAGFEEERDPGGRLVLAAYVGSPVVLPEGHGPWRVDTVDGGWETRWREFHRGGVVAEALWVGPPWQRPRAGLPAVVIDPGRAFGTGQHPTTLACLELLLRLPAAGAVADLGCGSGVLSIAAAKLGFGPVAALDVDPLAVAATRLNAAANDVVVEARQADALSDPLPAAPLWLANIMRAPLEAIFARGHARPERAILSGLRVEEAFVPAGYREAARVVRDGWVALLVEREPA